MALLSRASLPLFPLPLALGTVQSQTLARSEAMITEFACIFGNIKIEQVKYYKLPTFCFLLESSTLYK